ncbi:hypothetical protein [Streptomyces sp. NPDC005485]|uniref:hypothetical protein n=1 Tax=Streptomyces sp. NPDC005485 TaxID=3155591 RepID=UPI0033B4DBC7
MPKASALIHAATAIVGLVAGGLIGYAVAGNSTDGTGQPSATATVTTTETAPQAPAASHSSPAQKIHSGEFAGDGTFIVGQDIKPGTYHTDGPEGGDSPDCFWERLSSTSGEANAVITSQATKGQTTVTIAASDKAFTTQGCKTWRKSE